MAKSLKSWILTGWRRWVLAAAALLLILVAISTIAGEDIRVWWILQGFDDDREETLERVRLLDLPYRGAIRRAMLRGGRPVVYQMDLCTLLLQAPFFDRAGVEEALGAEDPLVQRAAVMTLLLHDSSSPPGAVPDRLLEILRDWGSDPTAMWLDGGLKNLPFYRDPRLVEILLPVAKAPPAKSDDLAEVARSNSAREVAARQLGAYIDEPGVAEGLTEVARREFEVREVRMGALISLLRGGFVEDIEVYEIASRNPHSHIRQVLADNLERVNDPRVIPILKRLLEDPKEVVRRGALFSLTRKRHPLVMEDIHYLAEDSYASIKGDLAMAVKDYRRRDLVPFLIWCLDDYEPAVVEKALESLALMTKKTYGFPWAEYRRVGVLERIQLVKDFMNDAERKAEAIEQWAAEYPPRYTEMDRVPHLVRHLMHADRQNVRRAIKELARVSGRREGLPAEVLDPAADAQAEDDALERFLRGDRAAVFADWNRWWGEQKKK